MMRAASLDPSQPRLRDGNGWRHVRLIALVVALALIVSPFGMIGMAEAHAQTMSGTETMAMAHCPSQNGENDRGQFDGAADCRAACAALAIQAPLFPVQIGGKIETPYPIVAPTPHGQSLGSDPPPPRTS